MNINTKWQRLGMWIAWMLGGYGSPSLYAIGKEPTLLWVWTGLEEDAIDAD